MTQKRHVSLFALPLAVLVGAVCAPPLMAERTVTTTLMPADNQPMTFEVGTEGVTLNFEANPLPSDARIDADGAEALMWIVRSDVNATAAEVVYDVDFVKGDQSQPMGSIPLSQNKPAEKQAATATGTQLPDWLPRSEGQKFDLLLAAREEFSRKRSWFGPGADSAVQRPRIALTYVDPDGVAPTFSLGLGASISPRSLNTAPRAQEATWLTPVTIATGVKSQTPAIDGALTYLVRNGALEAYRAPSSRPVWSVPGIADADHITLTALGRLHVIGGGRIRSFQLAEDRTAPPTEVLVSGDNPVEPGRTLKADDLTPVAPPVAGPDGSLYITSNAAIVGINTALRALWRLAYAGDASRPTVGPSGDFVYVAVAPKSTELPARLLAIDARTGEMRSVDLFGNLHPATLAAPVVIDAGERGEQVLVSAGGNDTGRIGLYTNLRTVQQGINRRTKWELKRTGEPLTGVWGVPLPDRTDHPTVRAFASLMTTSKGEAGGQAEIGVIKWNNDGLEHFKELETVAYEGPSFRSTAGRLTQDANGILYAFNGKRSVVTVETGSEGTAPPRADLDASLPNGRLFFGGDGTLHVMDPAAGVLRALIPTLDASRGAADCPDDVKPAAEGLDAPTACFDSPTHLRLTGDVPEGSRISVGGAIQFMPGTSLATNTSVRLVPDTEFSGRAD